MSTTDRDWMYQRLDEHGYISPVYTNGLKTFIEFACSKPSFMDGNLIKCPCKKKCKNRAYQEVDIVKFHLLKFGFVPNYFLWDRHGETKNDQAKQVNDNVQASREEVDDNHMIYEAVKGQDRKRKVNEVGSYDNSVSKTRGNSSKTATSSQSDAELIQRLMKIADGQNIIIEDQLEMINKLHEQMEKATVVIQTLREKVEELTSEK